jgi:hypothetical protein
MRKDNFVICEGGKRSTGEADGGAGERERMGLMKEEDADDVERDCGGNRKNSGTDIEDMESGTFCDELAIFSIVFLSTSLNDSSLLSTTK